MKAIKMYLIVVTVLLLVALFGVVYVWSLYQNVQDGVQVGTPVPSMSTSVPDVEEGTKEAPLQDAATASDTTKLPESPEPAAPMTIDATTLTESQRAILETFGFSGDTITVSDALITCAKDAVGETRFLEIINGAAPSPLEALALVPCAKK